MNHDAHDNPMDYGEVPGHGPTVIISHLAGDETMLPRAVEHRLRDDRVSVTPPTAATCSPRGTDMNTAQKTAAKATSDERETAHKLSEAGHANATRVATSNELSRARARLKEAETAHAEAWDPLRKAVLAAANKALTISNPFVTVESRGATFDPDALIMSLRASGFEIVSREQGKSETPHG